MRGESIYVALLLTAGTLAAQSGGSATPSYSSYGNTSYNWSRPTPPTGNFRVNGFLGQSFAGQQFGTGGRVLPNPFGFGGQTSNLFGARSSGSGSFGASLGLNGALGRNLGASNLGTSNLGLGNVGLGGVVPFTSPTGFRGYLNLNNAGYGFGNGFGNGLLIYPGLNQNQAEQPSPSFANPAPVKELGELPAALTVPTRTAAVDDPAAWADLENRFASASADVSAGRRAVEELRNRLDSIGQSPRAELTSRISAAEASLQLARDEMESGSLDEALATLRRTSALARQVLQEFGR